MSDESSAIDDLRRHVMNDKLVRLMADLKEKETIEMVKELIKVGTDLMEILVRPVSHGDCRKAVRNRRVLIPTCLWQVR
jgi:methanogenic corrinoid protein MtbC1